VHPVGGAAPRRSHLDVRLFLDSVHVLVQAIQEEGQELLAVLLPVAAENVAEAADFGLEAPGSDVLYSNLSGKEGRLR